jgi:tetratricopeptide (TPR) repeat protein
LDRIVSLEPDGSHAAAASFNAGFAYEQLGKTREALERYRRVVERFPEAAETTGALLRGSRLLARAEDWEGLALYGELMLARGDLSVVDRIEALGAHGLGLAAQGQLDKATVSISKARTLIEDHGFQEVGKLTLGMAQVFFALGEVLRLRGEQIVFVPRPDNFSEVLEQRCQSLLDAQDAYATAMRAYDAHWSAMAGYRVGGMYQQLHRDIMGIPAPSAAKTSKQRALFEGAMQLRYRVLLEKGLKMMDRTLAMAERTGESSSWVHRARDAKRDLELALEAATQSLAKLPYTEQDLQRALDDIAGKGKLP